MSIRKKILIFVVLLVMAPMLVLFVSSTFVLKKQKNNNELLYLKNSLKIVRTQMLSRKDEMERSALNLAQNYEFSSRVRDKNLDQLEREIRKIKTVYEYLDIVVVLDAEHNLLARSSPGIRADAKWSLNGLVQWVQTRHKPVASEEVFALSELFYPDSFEFNQLKIPIVNQYDSKGQQVFLNECQIGIVVVPVSDPEDPYRMLGYLILGDTVNNDKYFPESYSKNVEGSYLAISIGGIRVTSNIQTPTQGNFIGSRIPVKNYSPGGQKNYNFGRVDFNDEVHVFLDEPIINHKGESIATIGVGIPEETFAAILSTNQGLILLVTLVCLVIVIIAGRYFAALITEPILVATRFAEELERGERNLVLREEWIRDPKSETTVLLTTFHKMARALELSEQTNETYLERLKQENLNQLELAGQLKILNDELEGKVAARTFELVQAIEDLKKSDGVKSRFLANMSHELRTPLSAIISSGEALIARVFGPLTDKQEKYIRGALNSGNHLLQLINDILDISKIEAGKMNLTVSEFYISDIIENGCAVVRSIADHKNIDITVLIETGDFKIRSDATKFKQILYNLLSNAVKFTPENGKVEIEACQQEQIVQVRIRDNGIGIGKEDQERVFVEFEQVDNSYRRTYEGAGLGLPLTKKLVEMQGGQIFLISKEGVGTEIVFTLPLDAAPVENTPYTMPQKEG